MRSLLLPRSFSRLLSLLIAGLLASSARAQPDEDRYGLGWISVFDRSNVRIEINKSTLSVQRELVLYQQRDAAKADSKPSWHLGRCESGERADLISTALIASASSPPTIKWDLLLWRKPELGSGDRAALLAACETATRADLFEKSRPSAQWSVEDLQALSDAWLHTSGGNGFEYLIVETSDPKLARMARVQRWGRGTRVPEERRKADSLVDVPVAWRVQLAELFEPGQRSPVFAVKQGEVTRWTILELVTRGPANPPKGQREFKRKAERWIADGLLPSPEALRTDPAERAKLAFWRAQKPEQIDQIPPDLSADVRFGNGMTPLSRAIFTDHLDVAAAILKRGANTALCGVWGCPLHAAFWLPEAERTVAAVNLLLEAGAKPDAIDPSFDAAASTPLVEAIRKRNGVLVDRLLHAGASPDGAPGAHYIPLQMALATGQRHQAEILLELGASPLPWSDRALNDLGDRSTLTMAAQEAKDPELSAWIEKLVMDAAAKSPRFRWDAHIEQDGKRLPLSDGATLQLRAAPFKLVLTLAPTSEATVSVAASRSAKLGAQVRRVDKHNGLFISSRSSALANVPEDDSYELLVYQATPPKGAALDSDWGGHMNLGRQIDGRDRKDFHEERKDKNQYVREFRSIVEVFDDDRPLVTTPLAALKGTRLTLALGAPLPIVRWGTDGLVAARVVTLVLR